MSKKIISETFASNFNDSADVDNNSFRDHPSNMLKALNFPVVTQIEIMDLSWFSEERINWKNFINPNSIFLPQNLI